MENAAVRNKLRVSVGKAIIALEFALATIVVVGTAWYLFVGATALIENSHSPTFFSQFIAVLLTAIIGIEVARVLITHNFLGILEIFGFVMARKILIPEATTLDVLVVVVAFAVLVYVRKMLIDQEIVT